MSEDITFTYKPIKRKLLPKMTWKNFLFHGFIFLLLTALSQIGGFIWIFTIILWSSIRYRSAFWIPFGKISTFIFFYILISWTLVPALSNKVPLPKKTHKTLAPFNQLTVILNRHYVQPEVYNALISASENFKGQFPNSKIYYLDASFPFTNWFPIPPHVTHGNGKKIDLAFYFLNEEGNYVKAEGPSAVGYGVMEGPLPGEFDQISACERTLYSYPDFLVPDWKKDQYSLDILRTKAMVESLIQEASVERFFLEQHLQDRLEVQDPRFRFQGCKSVRHDDHIHVDFK